MADVIVIGEIGDNEATQVERVDRTLMLVDDFTVGADEHGVRDRNVPIGVEGGEQGVNVRGTENKIVAGGVQFYEGGKRGGLLVRIVDAHGHDFKGAMAVHTQHGLHFGHFLDARSTPGSPEIHQAEFAAGILA